MTRICAEGGSDTPASTAKALLTGIGCLGDIAAASRRRQLRLAPHDGAGIDAVTRFARAMSHALHCRMASGPVLATSSAVRDYLLARMSRVPNEQVLVLFLDVHNRLILAQTMFSGILDKVTFGVREIIARALDLNAAALIVAHNHPSGSPVPSSADFRCTRDLHAAAALFGIELHDHLVVGRYETTSLKAIGGLS